MTVMISKHAFNEFWLGLLVLHMLHCVNFCVFSLHISLENERLVIDENGKIEYVHWGQKKGSEELDRIFRVFLGSLRQYLWIHVLQRSQ